MFLTATDFNIIPYNLPNLDKVGSAFQTYVDRTEKEILISLLGVDTYEAFVAGMATPGKWKDLKDGVNYAINESNYVWVGMLELLRPIIYSKWINDDFQRYTGIGAVIKKGENATVINPIGIVTDAYNKFARLAGSHHDQKNTLYGFLVAGDYDFTEFPTFWHSPDRVNKFGI